MDLRYSKSDNTERRDFLRIMGAIGMGLILPVSMGSDHTESKEASSRQDKEEEIPPTEDLMREHGVLKRVLLIYDEGVRRIRARQDLPPEALADAARIIRSFIEDYHEKLEENYLFPRFMKSGKLTGLVDVLVQQHKAGRRLTDITLRLATLENIENTATAGQLADSMHLFIRMYNPHEAREDTILFPAFRSIVTPNEFDSLGEEFEKKERQLFGEDGFERIVDKVATIEKSLGIYDLSHFTPKI